MKLIENDPTYWDVKQNLNIVEIRDEFEKRKEGMSYWTMRHLLNHVKKEDGKILDAGCFPKGTKILNDKLIDIPIEELKEGDKIITHKGNVKKISKVFKRKADKFITIECPLGFSLKATSEHPIFAIKRKDVMCYKSRTCNTNKENNSCKRCGKIKYAEPVFIEMKDLEKGDFVAIPKEFNIKIKKKENHGKDFAWFLGWYLAEGSIKYSHKPKVCGVVLTLNIHKKKEAQKLKKIALKFGCKFVSIIERKERNTIDVICYSKKFTELILNLGGRYSDKKKLNNCVFSWSLEEQRQVLKGYFEGDGYHRKVNKGGEQYVVKTVSEHLAKHIKILLNMQGCCPGFSVYKSKVKNKKNIYCISLSGMDCSIISKRVTEYPKHNRVRQNKKYLFVPIDKIKKMNGEQNVYNFEVEDDNSYLANGVCVHNCGDSRYVIYLTLKKGYDIRGCDFASERIKYTKSIGFGNKIKEGNVLHLPYKDDMFDVYLSIGVLHHLDLGEYDMFFNEMKRVLKHDRKVFVTVPRGNSKASVIRKAKGKIKKLVYQRYFTLPEVDELFEAQGLEKIVSFEDKHNIVMVAKTK